MFMSNKSESLFREPFDLSCEAPVDGHKTQLDIIKTLIYLGVVRRAVKHIPTNARLGLSDDQIGVSVALRCVPGMPGYPAVSQTGLELSYPYKPGDFMENTTASQFVPVVHEPVVHEFEGKTSRGDGFTHTDVAAVEVLAVRWMQLEFDKFLADDYRQ